jgi:WD40 repeat protein
MAGVDPPGLSFIMAISFSPDGRRLAFSGFDPYRQDPSATTASVDVRDPTSLERLLSLEGQGVTFRLAFSPDSRLLATSGTRGVKLWEAATGNLVRSWDPGGSAAFSPDGKSIACGSRTAVTFWDVATGAKLRKFPSGGGRVFRQREITPAL